ncbi:nucleoside hydrolase [Corynebacterium sp. ES2775-CONJ]|uniref:nucleoside hydrolase n=1 Tax=Corynebacterium sp. ES2775-CONJ TaxID=2974029 RepID=UPI00216832FE|nr:nucleoside hydrolase [Corynebacterium sp. ES2775-CONJ]MCS4489131.1 nucleoside hydrolase [Corynebacterium sp. ES2775-CONJ]
MYTKIILDLDTGIDDALAIAYTLGYCAAHPEVELVGITSTYGNVDIATSVRNNLAVTQLFKRSDIKVYAGPPKALGASDFRVLEISSFIHGANGIANMIIPEPHKSGENRDAADFLITSVHTFGDDLVIIPTGPLTTIATAIAKDPTFAHKAHIVFMGGALTVPGNVKPWAEANIHQDPEAADRVLREVEDITMVGLDITLQTLLTPDDLAIWRELENSRAEFITALAEYYIDAYAEFDPTLGGCGLHDPLAVAIALNPDLAVYHNMNLMVDTAEPLRGRTTGDTTRLGNHRKNVKVALGVDVQRFKQLFMHYTTLAAS